MKKGIKATMISGVLVCSLFVGTVVYGQEGQSMAAGTTAAVVTQQNQQQEKQATESRLRVQGSQVKTLSIASFAKKLEKITGKPVLKEGEFKHRSEAICYADAAILIRRADEMLHGKDKFKKSVYQEVVEKKRLVGLAGTNSKQKKALRICFAQGIMPGTSNGSYSQSRTIVAKNKLTTSDAHGYLVRLKQKSKRLKLSPDGQVIRTSNLPKNYKKFPYILASFPNQFYESPFEYKYYTPKLKKNKGYYDPKDIRKAPFYLGGTMEQVLDQYLDKWCDKVETNLKTRFSFDYQKSGKNWINTLRKSYVVYNDAELDKPQTDAIKKYVKLAKKNKVKLTCGKVVVEPSTIYDCSGSSYIRTYVTFKVNCNTLYSADSNKQNEVIFGNTVKFHGLKKNKWYTAVLDIKLSLSAHGDDGADVGVSSGPRDFLLKE